MIQNRFTASTVYEDEAEKVYTDIVLDRRIFSSIFDALASTPAGSRSSPKRISSRPYTG